MLDQTKHLYEIITRVIENRADEITINPAWIATEAMAVSDPDGTANPTVYHGCHLQFRQIARSICRGKFEEAEGDESQHSLFPDLQTRYPVKRKQGEEPEYKLLEELTDEDVQYNVNRLTLESAKKMKHARALSAWHLTRRAAA